jgi:hypothetical protein
VTRPQSNSAQWFFGLKASRRDISKRGPCQSAANALGAGPAKKEGIWKHPNCEKPHFTLKPNKLESIMEIMDIIGPATPVPPPTATAPRSKRSVSADVTESAAQAQPRRIWDPAPWSLLCLILGVSLLAISVELVVLSVPLFMTSLVLAVATMLNRHIFIGLILVVLLFTVAPIALRNVQARIYYLEYER